MCGLKTHGIMASILIAFAFVSMLEINYSQQSVSFLAEGQTQRPAHLNIPFI